MGKRFRILWAGLLVVILGVVGWAMLLRPRGAVYQGKTPEQWLREYARASYGRAAAVKPGASAVVFPVSALPSGTTYLANFSNGGTTFVTVTGANGMTFQLGGAAVPATTVSGNYVVAMPTGGTSLLAGVAGPNAQVREAMEHFDSAAVPALAAAYLRRDGTAEKFLQGAWRRLPVKLQAKIPEPLRAEQMAGAARAMMGPFRQARPGAAREVARRVVPALVVEMNETNVPDTRLHRPAALLQNYLSDFGVDYEFITLGLVDLLKSGDRKARAGAAGALAVNYYLWVPIKEFPKIIAAAEDADLETRRNCIVTLGHLGFGRIHNEVDEAIPALEKALGDRRVRLEAAVALWQVARRTNEVVGLLAGETQDGTGRAAKVLAEIGPDAKDAVPALLRAARAGNTRDRLFACEALARIDAAQGPVVLETLTRLLADPSSGEWELREATRVLGEMGPAAKPAFPAMAKLLENKSYLVRQAASYYLASIDAAAAEVLADGQRAEGTKGK